MAGFPKITELHFGSNLVSKIKDGLEELLELFALPDRSELSVQKVFELSVLEGKYKLLNTGYALFIDQQWSRDVFLHELRKCVELLGENPAGCKTIQELQQYLLKRDRIYTLKAKNQLEKDRKSKNTEKQPMVYSQEYSKRCREFLRQNSVLLMFVDDQAMQQHFAQVVELAHHCRIVQLLRHVQFHTKDFVPKDDRCDSCTCRWNILDNSCKCGKYQVYWHMHKDVEGADKFTIDSTEPIGYPSMQLID
jgi:hypothetical protein